METRKRARICAQRRPRGRLTGRLAAWRLPAWGRRGGGLFVWGLAVCGLLAWTFAGAGQVQAAELVMFDSPTCVYCRRFKREAAPLYHRSPAAKVLPLRIVQIDKGPLWFRLKEAVRTTPTFVIVEHGEEVERFSGYSDRDDFLDMMNSLTEAYRNYR